MHDYTYGKQDNVKLDKSAWVFPNANGLMPIQFGWRGRFAKLEMYGGPFRNYRRLTNLSPHHDLEPTQTTYGVCLLERPLDTADASMPIQDFGVPTQTHAEVTEQLVKAYAKGFRGKTIYAGCMGGIGRTGIFLALMAKIAGHSDPVAYVRSTFLPHAVETEQQKKYINDFDVGPAQKAVHWDAWKSLIFRK